MGFDQTRPTRLLASPAIADTSADEADHLGRPVRSRHLCPVLAVRDHLVAILVAICRVRGCSCCSISVRNPYAAGDPDVSEHQRIIEQSAGSVGSGFESLSPTPSLGSSGPSHWACGSEDLLGRISVTLTCAVRVRRAPRRGVADRGGGTCKVSGDCAQQGECCGRERGVDVRERKQSTSDGNHYEPIQTSECDAERKFWRVTREARLVPLCSLQFTADQFVVPIR